MRKKRDLAILGVIYAISFAVGYLLCRSTAAVVWRFFVFDLAATVVVFVFSVLLKNSSVYDAYWSLTPMVMSIWLFVGSRAFSPLQLLFLAAFNLWGARLTGNWIAVFTDFSYEDWRYRKYREESSPWLWPVINFFGIHMVPTLIVFAGMLPLFVIVKTGLGKLSLLGVLVMLLGVLLEYLADTRMHSFLRQAEGKTVCREGVWKYSRHPNYLGEITFWLGVYLAMVFCAPDRWYCGLGFVSVAVLFNVVSIPLMEKRQLARRPEYADYIKQTSRLLLRNHKKG